MTDQEILALLGLSETEATDLSQKVASLSSSQVEVLASSSTDVEEAAAALGTDCSQDDLHRFLNARKGSNPGSAQIYFMPQEEVD